MRIAFGPVFLFGPKNGDLIWEWRKLLRRSVHCCAYAAPSPPFNVSDEDDCVYRILGTLQYFSQVPAGLETLMVGHGVSLGATTRIALHNHEPSSNANNYRYSGIPRAKELSVKYEDIYRELEGDFSRQSFGAITL